MNKMLLVGGLVNSFKLINYLQHMRITLNTLSSTFLLPRNEIKQLKMLVVMGL